MTFQITVNLCISLLKMVTIIRIKATSYTFANAGRSEPFIWDLGVIYIMINKAFNEGLDR